MAYREGILFCPALPSIIPFASIRPPKVDIPPTDKLLLTTKSWNVSIPAGG